MSHPIIVSYNSASLKERGFVKELLDYVGTKNIHAIANDPNVSESEMKRWLLSAQWLVLILSPEALRSPRVHSLINTAFGYIKQGNMQGILAIASSSNPIELEDLPPLWSTIRIYYTGERNEDLQQAFEKLSRTLGYDGVPVPSTASSMNNWVSSFSSAASRPQSTMRQTTRRANSRLVIPFVAALVLIIFFLAYFLGVSLIFNHQPHPTSTSNGQAITSADKTLTAIVKASATAHAKATVTSEAIATATTSSQQSNSIAQEHYNTIINSTSYALNDSMSSQDDNQWTNVGSCSFINGEYQVNSSSDGQYVPCMEKKYMNFKYFAYQVQMMFIQGDDEGGLIFRSNNAVSLFYRFSLTKGGNYSLRLCNICSSQYNILEGTQLISGNNVSLDQTNTLTVIALKKTIYLYVNGVFVGNVDNSTISQGGEIGVYAASPRQPTVVAFSNVKLWQLSETGQVLQ